MPPSLLCKCSIDHLHPQSQLTSSTTCSKEDSDCIYVDNDTRIQIMNTMAFLPRADKEQCAAFIVRISKCDRPSLGSDIPSQRDERVMVVWTYDLDSIIPTCRDFEEKLIKLVWTRRSAFASLASSAAPSTTASDVNLTEKTRAPATEKETVELAPKDPKKTPAKKRSCDIFGYWKADANDIEKTAEGPSARPIRLFAPVYSGLGAALSLCAYPLRICLHILTGTCSLRWERRECAAGRGTP